MRLTVFWEDQRGVGVKGFGPHELLVSCVADELQAERIRISPFIDSHPKKGNSNVRLALQRDGSRLRKVFAVVDRDKIRELWKKPGPMPGECRTEIRLKLSQEVPTPFELILLENNVETLLGVVADVLKCPYPATKPTPNERDQFLQKAAWADSGVRERIRERCPSFNRIVIKVAEALRAVFDSSS